MTSWPENWEKLDAVYSYRFTAFEVIGVIVCKNCSNLDAPLETKALKYPGDIPHSVAKLNYREKSFLSPIKIMSQITRKSTVTSGRIGHYEMKGYLGLKNNYELFASMAYGGMIGLQFRRGLQKVDMDRVKEAYCVLFCETNPLLAQYILDLDKVKDTVEYNIRQNNQ
ncbi:unnamed protein product [Mucor circinelloides]